jgi:hypothetical protein
MTRSRRKVRLALCGMLFVHTPTIFAQTVEARVGRFFDSSGWTTYRLGVSRPLIGIFRLQLHGDVLRVLDGSTGGLAGVGGEITAFRQGREGPYLIAGLSGGLGSETSNKFDDAWGSWSVGAGYDVFPLAFLSTGVEGRWRELSLGGRQGFELAIGFALHLSSAAGSRTVPPPTPGRAPTAEGTLPVPMSDPELQAGPMGLTDSIVATATTAMGRPYQFGGTGAGGGGFDCSGLIQYAYQKHGIVLPRRSVDQAKQGKKIDRKVDRLRPADLLTFSNHGGSVTHVGLYVGEGRFIHSATRGVQISTLSPEDPYGRWWYKRWVGVRRIVP